MKKWLHALICAAFMSQALAETPPDPESTLLAYTEATRVYDAALMAHFMHPDALRKFRTAIDAALAGPKSATAKTELLPLFAVQTLEEFEALSDVDAFRRMNETVSKASPELRELMAIARYEIVGTVHKDGLAYVTYTLNVVLDGRPVSSQVVQTLKRHDDKWLLMLPASAGAAVAKIESRYQ
jgi:hypothetical protein